MLLLPCETLCLLHPLRLDPGCIRRCRVSGKEEQQGSPFFSNRITSLSINADSRKCRAFSFAESETTLLFLIHIIKKPRPQQKSRFVHQLLPKGFNSIFFLLPLAPPQETALPYPLAAVNGAVHTECCVPIPRGSLSKADARSPNQEWQAARHCCFRSD